MRLPISMWQAGGCATPHHTSASTALPVATRASAPYRISTHENHRSRQQSMLLCAAGVAAMDVASPLVASSSNSSIASNDMQLNQWTSSTQGEDTIVSIVTGTSTNGSVAVIRLSGSEAVEVAGRVFRPGGRSLLEWTPQSHRVYYGNAVDGDMALLDEVLLLCMRAPRSYTREDVVELHCHGGGICAQRVLRACVEAGARPARPGEFTLRAFLNGRLDLSQAESVMQLVSARTPAAADSALAGLQGGLGQAVAAMRESGLQLLAELEARLDFDEEMPAVDLQRLQDQVEQLQQAIEGALRTARQGNLLRQGLQVAIVGRPNVGKSSLLNAWSRTDRAIVTEVAGTTRDVLEAGLVVKGVPVTLLDTAGIRDSSDVVERIGVARSQAAAVAADVVVMVVDAAAGWTREDSDIYTSLWGQGTGSSSCKVQGLALLVANKADLVQSVPTPHTVMSSRQNDSAGSNQETTATSNSGSSSNSGTSGSDRGGSTHSSSGGSSSSSSSRSGAASHLAPHKAMSLPLLCKDTFLRQVHTSAVTRQGLDDLDTAILELAGAPQLAAGGISWAVNERQADALVSAHEALMRVSESVKQDLPLDFWTIDLRSAVVSLGEVNGDEVTEQVLDNIFSRFCIGK